MAKRYLKLYLQFFGFRSCMKILLTAFVRGRKLQQNLNKKSKRKVQIYTRADKKKILMFCGMYLHLFTVGNRSLTIIHVLTQMDHHSFFTCTLMKHINILLC